MRVVPSSLKMKVSEPSPPYGLSHPILRRDPQGITEGCAKDMWRPASSGQSDCMREQRQGLSSLYAGAFLQAHRLPHVAPFPFVTPLVRHFSAILDIGITVALLALCYLGLFCCWCYLWLSCRWGNGI